MGELTQGCGTRRSPGGRVHVVGAGTGVWVPGVDTYVCARVGGCACTWCVNGGAPGSSPCAVTSCHGSLARANPGGPLEEVSVAASGEQEMVEMGRGGRRPQLAQATGPIRVLCGLNPGAQRGDRHSPEYER